MSRVILTGDTQRDHACRLIREAEPKAVMTITKPTRSNRQNALLWALLTDISEAKPDGRQHTPDVWKALFMHSLGYQVQFEMALDGQGPFPLGFRSSKLTVEQMNDLLELIFEYGSRHGVVFSEPDWREMA